MVSYVCALLSSLSPRTYKDFVSCSFLSAPLCACVVPNDNKPNELGYIVHVKLHLIHQHELYFLHSSGLLTEVLVWDHIPRCWSCRVDDCAYSSVKLTDTSWFGDAPLQSSTCQDPKWTRGNSSFCPWGAFWTERQASRSACMLPRCRAQWWQCGWTPSAPHFQSGMVSCQGFLCHGLWVSSRMPDKHQGTKVGDLLIWTRGKGNAPSRSLRPSFFSASVALLSVWSKAKK